MEQQGPTNRIGPELRSAAIFSSVQQAAIVITCAFLKDGGVRLRASLIGLAVFWAMFAFIVFLRGSKPIKVDTLFVRWSYPLIWLLAVILTTWLAKLRVT